MTYKTERENFFARMAANGVKADDTRKLLRLAATHGRLAVASCNGDYPADNGERRTKPCPKCEGLWYPASFRKGVCPDCRTEALIMEHADRCGFAVEFQGDPRGYTVKVLIPNAVTGTPWEYGVPQRS